MKKLKLTALIIVFALSCLLVGFGCSTNSDHNSNRDKKIQYGSGYFISISDSTLMEIEKYRRIEPECEHYADITISINGNLFLFNYDDNKKKLIPVYYDVYQKVTIQPNSN